MKTHLVTEALWARTCFTFVRSLVSGRRSGKWLMDLWAHCDMRCAHARSFPSYMCDVWRTRTQTHGNTLHAWQRLSDSTRIKAALFFLLPLAYLFSIDFECDESIFHCGFFSKASVVCGWTCLPNALTHARNGLSTKCRTQLTNWLDKSLAAATSYKIKLNFFAPRADGRWSNNNDYGLGNT